MDILKLKKFCENFEISDENLSLFLDKKKIIKNNNNYFLINNNDNFKPNQIYKDNLIYIELKNNLFPSKYLLEFLKNNTRSIKIKGSKQALNFTYGKSLHLDSVRNKKKFLIQDNYHIVIFEDEILGYAKIDFNQRFPIINLMNVGEYLKEN